MRDGDLLLLDLVGVLGVTSATSSSPSTRSRHNACCCCVDWLRAVEQDFVRWQREEREAQVACTRFRIGRGGTSRRGRG